MVFLIENLSRSPNQNFNLDLVDHLRLRWENDVYLLTVGRPNKNFPDKPDPCWNPWLVDPDCLGYLDYQGYLGMPAVHKRNPLVAPKLGTFHQAR